MSVGVFLGGDTVSRGIVRTSRAEAGDIATLGVFGAGAVAVLTAWGASMWSAVTAAGIAAIGLGVCLPWQLIRDATGGTSLRGWLGVRIGFRWRRSLSRGLVTESQLGVPTLRKLRKSIKGTGD